MTARPGYVPDQHAVRRQLLGIADPQPARRRRARRSLPAPSGQQAERTALERATDRLLGQDEPQTPREWLEQRMAERLGT